MLLLLSVVMLTLRYQFLSVWLSVYTVSLICIVLLYMPHDAYAKFQFRFQDIIFGIILGCTVYMLEVAAYFMITKKSLIVDIAFYFKGTLNFFIFLVSSGISVLEELVWRQALFFKQEYMIVSIFVSSLIFGLCHVVFGKWQVLFKSILGLVLAVSYLLSRDILFVITIHVSYNYLMLKKSGKGKWHEYKGNEFK